MQGLIEPLGLMLVHSVWLISLIVGVAALVSSRLQRRSADARYFVACVALVLSVSVLPGVFAWMMSQRQEMADSEVSDRHMLVNVGDTIDRDGSGEAVGTDLQPGFIAQPVPLQAAETQTANGSQIIDDAVIRSSEISVIGPRDHPSIWLRIEAQLQPHLVLLVSGWLMGVCFLSVRPLIGWHSARRLQRVGLSEVSDSLQEMLSRLSGRLGLKHVVRLFQSGLVQIPCVIGAFRPVILLPASAISGLSPEQLEALLAHELAHIRRHDFAMNFVQTLVETLLFYHPAIWWLSHRVRQEREHCCDDLAISVCGDVAGYARMLVSVEGLRGRVPQASVAASGGSLVERIRRLLPSPPEQTRSPWMTGFAVLATLTVLIGSWQWSVGQVSNLLKKDVAETKDVSAGTDQAVEAAKAGHVENVPHKDWPQWGRTSLRNNAAEGPLPLEWNLAKGTNIVWKAKLGTSTYSSPVVSGGKVFIGTNNGTGLNPAHPKEKDMSCLVCFDQATGQFLWQYASEKLPAGRVHDWPNVGLCSTACVDGDRVWVVTNRCEVICLDANGFRDGENDGPFSDEPAQTEIDADVIWKFDMFGDLGVRPLSQSVSSITQVDGVLLLNTSNGPDESRVKIPAPSAPNFLALDARTGRVIWKDNSAGESIVVGRSICSWSGASPSVATLGGVTQAIFTGKEGWVYGYDFTDLKLGKTTLLWQFDCNPKTANCVDSNSRRNTLMGSPVVADGRVYVATGREPEHGEGDADLWCIDPTKRGNLSSELVFNKSFENGEKPIPHKPLCACEADKGDFVRPNPNSGAIWHFATADHNGNGKIEFDETFHRSLGSPVIHDGLLFIADASGLLHCLDSKTGAGQWTHDLLAACWSSCTIADGHVLIGDEDGCLEIFKAARTKQSLFGDMPPNFGSSIYATPVVVDGTLFIATKDSLVAIRDPKQVATNETDDDFFVTVSRGQPVTLEFDQAVKRVEGFDPQMLKVTTRSPTSVRVESVNVGLTIVTVTDDKGSEFVVPIEVLPEAKPALSLPTTESFRPKPGKNPLLCPVLIHQDKTTIALGNQLPRFLEFPERIRRVHGYDPLLLQVSALTPYRLLVNGLTTGTTTFVAETEDGKHTVEFLVTPEKLSREKIRRLFAADDGELPNPAARVEKQTAASWTSFRHDLAQTGVASSLLPDKLELLWETNLGGQVVGTAAIVGDHVYVPCLSGELVCLDRKSGQKLWAYRSVSDVRPNSFAPDFRPSPTVTDTAIYQGDEAVKLKTFAPGFQSSPTVTRDAIYLGDEDGLFHCIDRATGKPRWTFKTGGEIFSSAAVVNGKVLFGSYDSHLYCLNESDGTLAWKFATQGKVHCAPAVVDGLVLIAGCDEHLRAIDIATGTEKKDIPLGSFLIASPAIVGNLAFVGTYGNEVLAVNRTTGDVAWRYSPGNGEFPFHSSAAVTEKLVVLGGRDKLVHGIDRATGKPLWTFATHGRVDSSPVVVGQRVFVGSDDGNLYELNAATGELRAKFNLGKPISASPAIGEGVLVIGSQSNDGRVVCFGGVRDVATSVSQIVGTMDDKSKTGDPRTNESSEPGSQRRANQTHAVEQTR